MGCNSEGKHGTVLLQLRALWVLGSTTAGDGWHLLAYNCSQASTKTTRSTRYIKNWQRAKQRRGVLREQHPRAGQKQERVRQGKGKHNNHLCDEIQDFPGIFLMDC